LDIPFTFNPLNANEEGPTGGGVAGVVFSFEQAYRPKSSVIPPAIFQISYPI
jgi:hypothetical protein